MRNQLLSLALVVGAVDGFGSGAFAHGGTYNGPGDTVPPGGGPSGGGGAVPSGPGPTPSGPNGPTGPGPGTGARPTVPTGGPGGSTGSVASGGQSASDPTTWEFWWAFNKAPYLKLKAAIHAGTVSDGDLVFQDPSARRNARDAMRPSDESIRLKVVPALEHALDTERANDILTGALIALAKIGEQRNEEGRPAIAPRIRRFLPDPVQEISETAALSLGILADEGSIPTLRELLVDGQEGRTLCGRNEVPYRTRAFAAYGLGLVGSRAADDATRREIARILMATLEAPESATRDVQVAALIALGLVPVDVDLNEAPDSRLGPADSRQSEIRWIQRYFQDTRRPWMARAHAPEALARLLSGAPPAQKDAVARALLDTLAPSDPTRGKEKDEVLQGCVLALGQIGDCDADAIDAEIRRTLERFLVSNDAQSRCFALIALGRIGGRAGSGSENEAVADHVRGVLIDTATKGRPALRPWAGLALGVQEHARIESGHELSRAGHDALRAALQDCTKDADLGAYAIGCGIAHDVDAKGLLLGKLSTSSDPTARGYVAVALGLVDARDAIAPIETIVRESKYQAELLREAAIGLGLLGDKQLVPDLVKMLREAQGLAAQAAVAAGLGFIGDARSVDPLVEMLGNRGMSERARGFAAVALGIVADREPLPWTSRISVDINYRANTTTLTGQDSTGILDIL